MALSGQLDVAWVCDDPYVQHEDQLALLAVPLYRRQPLYQTHVIVNERSGARPGAPVAEPWIDESKASNEDQSNAFSIRSRKPPTFP